jgi:hypothetical protein
MKMSHLLAIFCLAALSSSAWAQSPSAPTDDERANLAQHADELRAEAVRLEDEARQAQASLDAQGECGLSARACKERELERKVSLQKEGILSADATEKLEGEIRALRVELESADSLKPRAETLKALASASAHVAATGDAGLSDWDKLNEFARLGETFKYSLKELIKPGPLLLLAGGNASWYALKKQQGVNQSVYNSLHASPGIPAAALKTGQYLPFVAAGATVPLYIVALTTDNKVVRDLAETFTVGITTNLLATEGLKRLLHDCRPGPVCVDRTGAPSGHASTSFVIATMLDHKFGHKWGILAYAVASSVVLTRLGNTDPKNVHTLGQSIDGALQGAAIGWATSRGQERAKEAHAGKRSFLSKLAYGNFNGGSYSCAPSIGNGYGGGCVIDFGK